MGPAQTAQQLMGPRCVLGTCTWSLKGLSLQAGIGNNSHDVLCMVHQDWTRRSSLDKVCRANCERASRFGYVHFDGNIPLLSFVGGITHPRTPSPSLTPLDP